MKEALRGMVKYIYYITFSFGVVMAVVGILFPLANSFWYFIFGLVSFLGGLSAMYGSSLVIQRPNQDSAIPAILLGISGILSLFIYMGYIGFFLSLIPGIVFGIATYEALSSSYKAGAYKYTPREPYDDDPTYWR